MEGNVSQCTAWAAAAVEAGVRPVTPQHENVPNDAEHEHQPGAMLHEELPNAAPCAERRNVAHHDEPHDERPSPLGVADASEAARLGPHSSLQEVLAAWHAATVRLAETHAALRAEVQRLTAELEAKNRDLARRNRLADLGRVASHVAHDVRNNLVPLKLYLSLLRRRLDGDETSRQIVDKLAAGLANMTALVNDLLHFAADRRPQRCSVSVAELLVELRSALAPQLAAQHVQLHVQCPDDLRVCVDRDMFRRVLLNLALNALDAMPDGGALHLHARADAQAVELRVLDTGPGLSDEALRRACEPFFTTKPNGTGLGLAIVHHLLGLHGGQLDAANQPGGGACFTLRIPDVPPVADGASPA
jgi:signal transduction histidine kinase